MEISPASLAQLRQAQNGAMVAIDDDVVDVARQLRDIDPGLHLRYSEAGGFFAVYHVTERAGDTHEHLVTTAQELDARLVERIRKIARPGYDFVAELERIDREADRAADHAISERVGEAAERLVHAVRKDLGVKDRAFTPGERRVA